MLNTSHSSATCMAGAPAYESQAMIYWPLRWAEITNSLPNSPEPNNKIFFINSFIYNFIYLRFDDVRCTIRVTLDNKPPQAKAIPIVHRKSSNSKSSYWCWRNGLQGLGNGRSPIVSSCIEMGVKIIATFALIPFSGYTGVCFAEPIAWSLMGPFLFIFFYRDLKKKERMLI